MSPLSFHENSAGIGHQFIWLIQKYEVVFMWFKGDAHITTK